MIRLLDRLSRGLNHLGTLLIVLAMLLVAADVFARGLFNSPIRGVPEMVGTSIVAIVFLQIPHALARGRMIRSDSLLHVLGKRSPAIAHALEAIFGVLGIVLFGAIVYAALPLVAQAIQARTFIGVQGFFTMPIWPVRVVIVVGCMLMALQYLRLCVDKARLAKRGAAWQGDVRG